MSSKSETNTKPTIEKTNGKVKKNINDNKDFLSTSKDVGTGKSKNFTLKSQSNDKKAKLTTDETKSNSELNEKKWNEIQNEVDGEAATLEELEENLTAGSKPKTKKKKSEMTPEEKELAEKAQKKYDELLTEKKQAKKEFKELNKKQKKMTKERVKEVKKLNSPHKGEKVVTMSDGYVIELKDIVKYYSNGYLVNKIIKGIDLKIKHGEFVVILGPSGSGKTTLMNIISGLDRASEGEVNVCGKNLINLTNNELTQFRRENVGYIFQQYGLLPNLTVKENVEIGAYLQKDKTKQLDVHSILKSVDMLDQENKFPHELSGGQQQRVSIARAFAKNPTILFGDEPTGAIDEEMSKMVLQQFVNINREFNTTVVIVTHNPIFADLGTCVIKVKDGKVASLTQTDKPKAVSELNWS